MESVSAAAPGLRRWFNIEPVADKGALQELLDRTAAAGYEALLVNVDCRAIGHRERDYRNGFTAPPTLKAKTVFEGARHPRWAAAQRRDRLPEPGRHHSDRTHGQ